MGGTERDKIRGGLGPAGGARYPYFVHVPTSTWRWSFSFAKAAFTASSASGSSPLRTARVRKKSRTSFESRTSSWKQGVTLRITDSTISNRVRGPSDKDLNRFSSMRVFCVCQGGYQPLCAIVSQTPNPPNPPNPHAPPSRLAIPTYNATHLLGGVKTNGSPL